MTPAGENLPNQPHPSSKEKVRRVHPSRQRETRHWLTGRGNEAPAPPPTSEFQRLGSDPVLYNVLSYQTGFAFVQEKKTLNCSHLGCKYNGKRRTNSQRNTLGLRATFVMKQMSHEDIHQATRKQKQTPGPRECYGSGSPWHAEWWPQKHRSRPVGWDCELLGRGPCTRNRSTHGEGSSRPAGRALSPATRVLRRAGQRQT